MIAFRFLEPAEEEMNRAGSFYEAASEGLGFDFLADVQFGIDSLLEHPYLGHAIDEGLRRLLLHRFPFSIVYSVEVDAILIVALAHYGRRPGYWKERVVS
jgi:plasmid stabilization system protein ParE